MLFSYKKYYKIVLYILGGLFIYYILKKKPEQFKNIVQSGNNLLKYMPIDKQAVNMLNPIFDLTNNSFVEKFDENMNNSLFKENETQPEPKNTPNTKVKRSVSESKKKYIGSKQGWKCSSCNKILDHTYEIDHKLALKDGGDNSIENLTALCVHCHRLKTLDTFIQ
jgi:predicted ATP-grasp superfamily ATP-dependent carboligase